MTKPPRESRTCCVPGCDKPAVFGFAKPIWLGHSDLWTCGEAPRRRGGEVPAGAGTRGGAMIATPAESYAVNTARAEGAVEDDLITIFHAVHTGTDPEEALRKWREERHD